jgi:hypothetical protein
MLQDAGPHLRGGIDRIGIYSRDAADQATACAFVERAFTPLERGIEIFHRKSEAGIAYLMVHHGFDGADGYSVVPITA